MARGKVFVNGREISGRGTKIKVKVAFPDVCMSPPAPPAGPLPVPYPNKAKSADTTDGSKTVKVHGQMVGLKNKSSYKSSGGDKAATRNFGAGLISHNIEGSYRHASYSFDVKIEGLNAVRHNDLVTGNHSNQPNDLSANKGAEAKAGDEATCKELQEANKERRAALGHQYEPSTITHGVFKKDGGPPENRWSCSRGDLAEKYKNGKAKELASRPALRTSDDKGKDIERYKHQAGLPRERVPDKDYSDVPGGQQGSNVQCPEAKKSNFKYQKTKSTERPHTSHTEARIIENIFERSNGGTVEGKLVMAIDWNQFDPTFVKTDSQTGKKIFAQPPETSTDPCPDCRRLICAAMRCGLTIVLCDGNGEPQQQKKKDCPSDLSGDP